uniref:Serpentine Receptor, class T n=2 Tax=Caenorhabditis tropicalis TaxID=1561998 RepID=A0A1I7U8L8_9PELO
MIGHILVLFLLTTPMVFPIGFSIERFIAIGMASRYETTPTLIGPILVVLLIIPNVIVFFFIFQNETFDDIFISFLMLPSTSANQFTSHLWNLMYIKVVNVICNIVLLMIQSVLKPKYQKSSLSTKYAMEEITQSPKFTLIVTFTHLLFFGVYTACSIFVRVLGQPFFGSFINFYVARGVNCAVPTYNFVVVIVGMITLRHLNAERSKAVQTTVRILSIGNEGAKNYDDAITNQWATITTSRL